MAVDMLHEKRFPDRKIVATTIPLLLVAKTLEIADLEKKVKNTLAQALTKQLSLLAGEVQVLELAMALREFYGLINVSVNGEQDDNEISNEVGAAIASAVASACWKEFKVLKKSEEFMGLLKEIPRLAVDILASGAEEDEEEIGKVDGRLQQRGANREGLRDSVDESWEVVEAD